MACIPARFGQDYDELVGLKGAACAALLIGVSWGSALTATAQVRATGFNGDGLLPLTVLAKLSTVTGTPMGVEWIGPDEGQPVRRTWESATVKTIALDILRSQRPQWQYSAKQDGQVLVLRPSAKRLARHSVLDIKPPLFTPTWGREAQETALQDLDRDLNIQLLNLPPPSTVISTGGATLPVTEISGSYRNTPVYVILDRFIEPGFSNKIWLVQDLPGCSIGNTNVWCTYTNFGSFNMPIPRQQPYIELIHWRTDPILLLNTTVLSEWPCPRCPPPA